MRREDPLRVLVDTNVWISAFINPRGLPAQVVAAFAAGQFVPVVSSALLNEIETVAQRPRVRRRRHYTDDDIREILTLIRDRGIEVSPPGELHACRDPRDDVILESAVLGGATYLVSRDDDLNRDLDLIDQLRVHGIQVVTASWHSSVSVWPYSTASAPPGAP